MSSDQSSVQPNPEKKKLENMKEYHFFSKNLKILRFFFAEKKRLFTSFCQLRILVFDQSHPVSDFRGGSMSVTDKRTKDERRKSLCPIQDGFVFCLIVAVQNYCHSSLRAESLHFLFSTHCCRAGQHWSSLEMAPYLQVVQDVCCGNSGLQLIPQLKLLNGSFSYWTLPRETKYTFS